MIDKAIKYVTVDAMQQVWLKEVAAAAEVSVSAASHAVNGTGTLSAKTRVHILEIAKKLGYQRNPILSSLAGRRFQSADRQRYTKVGLISFVQHDHRLESLPEFPMDPATSTAQSFGFVLQPHQVLRNHADLESYLAHARTSGIEALLIGSSDCPDAYYSCDLGKFSVLGIGDIAGDFSYHKMERDWGYSVRVCYQKLLSAGCRRIGGCFYGRANPTSLDGERLGALLSEQAVHSELIPVPPYIADSFLGDSNLEFMEWYDHHRPDGIIGWALDPLYRLIESGVGIPDQLQVALLSKQTDPHWYDLFAGMQYDPDFLIRQSLRMLFDQLTHAERGLPPVPMTYHLRMPWLDGPSIRTVT